MASDFDRPKDPHCPACGAEAREFVTNTGASQVYCQEGREGRCKVVTFWGTVGVSIDSTTGSRIGGAQSSSAASPQPQIGACVRCGQVIEHPVSLNTGICRTCEDVWPTGLPKHKWDNEGNCTRCALRGNNGAFYYVGWFRERSPKLTPCVTLEDVARWLNEASHA